MKCSVTALSLGLLAWGSVASAAEPVRVHVEVGASHAVTGEQAGQFGGGGEGKASVELAPTARFGIQAGVGALILSKGDSESSKTVAPTSTGVAYLGTLGFRLRAFGSGHPGGPFIDANAGGAHTGDVMRPAFDAHIGWDVRATEENRIDVAPYLGYTEIFQPAEQLRSTDARILTFGVQVSLGAKAAPKAAPEPKKEAAPPPPPELVEVIKDHDGDLEAMNSCPDNAPAWEDGCVGEMHIFENKIYLDDIIHFDFGKAKIRGESFRVVKKLAGFINEHTEITDVQIEGHADEIGGDAINQALSVDRATAMRELLVWYGADAKRLHIVGFGKSRPKIVTLKAEEKNRRVELFVTTVVKSNDHQSGVAANASHGKNAQ